MVNVREDVCYEAEHPGWCRVTVSNGAISYRGVGEIGEEEGRKSGIGPSISCSLACSGQDV